ncbi:hypothetical protein E2562_006314 [Oryza meyeriana var. granulata]|uniref:VQ domain-containing protein n=1 Tax=Oryza meyeriana var. granulata TaxID=110450 RepID=A0A6G1EF21_9ORYZ|nr:hypothetical protein E2562_006314 [Oryza meyeriana var. granulata]
MDKKQCGSRGGGGNARRSAAAGSSGRLHRKGRGGGGGKKREIKVVYISNPMWVTTSEEGFRTLVQELTGRHADPSKYSVCFSPLTFLYGSHSYDDYDV